MIKKTLITGGSGLLALNWAIHKRDIHDIHLIQHERNISLPGTTFSKINLADPTQIEQTLRDLQPDLVIHTAGQTNIEACEQNPDLAYEANVQLSENIARKCQKQNIKMVHISTDHLFDGNSQYVTENTPTTPLNIYGKTKAKAEKCVSEYNPEALIIRTNIFGWGTTYRHSFSDYVIENLTNKKSITLFEDVHFTPILIADLVDHILALVEKKQSGIYNIAASTRISKLKFGLLLAKHFNLDSSYITVGRISDKPDLVLRPKDMSLSTEKISKVLDLKMPTPTEAIAKLHQQEKIGIARELKSL